MSILMSQKSMNATVTVAHSRTKNTFGTQTKSCLRQARVTKPEDKQYPIYHPAIKLKMTRVAINTAPLALTSTAR